MADDKIKVLYIAGWGRGGSTVLSTVLGHLDGFFPAGEVHQVWKNGIINNEPCGCGELFSECRIWNRIMEDTYNRGFIEPARMIEYKNRAVRIRRLPLMAISPGAHTFEKDYIDSLGNLYKSIHRMTGSRVIVDSSKDAVYAQVLRRLPFIDLYVLHLVRDPRAVAFSWQRRKEIIPGYDRIFSRKGSVQSSLKWLMINWIIQFLHKKSKRAYMLVRYEDFVFQPSVVLADILDFVSEQKFNVPSTFNQEMESKVNHMIGGNPMRFQRGKLKLSMDEEWVSGMKKRDKALITMLTLPLSMKYKYV